MSELTTMLKNRIQDNALTLKEAAKVMGISRSTLYNLVHESKPTRLHHIQRLPKDKYNLTKTQSVGEFLKRLRLMSGMVIIDYASNIGTHHRRWGALEMNKVQLSEKDLKSIFDSPLVPRYAKSHLGKLYIEQFGVEV